MKIFICLECYLEFDDADKARSHKEERNHNVKCVKENLGGGEVNV